MSTIESRPTEAGRPSGHPEGNFARQMSSSIRDLVRPNPAIFWGDLLVSVAIGYVALWQYLVLPPFSVGQLIAFFVAGFALYRALMFTHELAHLPSGRFGGFRVMWNVLVGVPFLTPSFLYAEHRTHHVNHSYGTKGDAEYVPIGRGPKIGLILFVAQGLIMPILAPIRFGLLAPISLLHPSLRRLVWERASGLTQNNLEFRRPPAKGAERLQWGLQEAGCFLVCVTVVTLIATGVCSWTILIKLYALFAFVTTMSYTRALSSHLYFNAGDEVSYLDQMFDSTTIPGHPLLTELWAPLGQRYHALHHVFPSIPYHALGIAHRRLMQQLPDDAPYRQTLRRGLWDSLRGVWNQTPPSESTS